MIIEGWDAAVRQADWALAREGNVEAIERIKADLHGVTLYLHNLTFAPKDAKDHVVVTVKELIEAGVIEALTVDCQFYIKPAPTGRVVPPHGSGP